MTPDHGTPLSRYQRAAALDAMQGGEVLDVLVIGGGVVGAGTALDAATRGLRVGLLEARDYAAGTSSRSSKLFHGGLRYLEQFDFHLVFEALKERSLVLNTLCPHLAKPVPFLFPLRRRGWDRAYAGLGTGVYDLMGAGRGVPHHVRHLGRRRTFESFPSGKRDAIVGSIRFYEGQVDDARHTMMLARTAVRHGAHCATSARVTGFMRDADRVVGAMVCDRETGQEYAVRARHVINAAGVWTDEIQRMLGGHAQLKVSASKGIHLLVPRERIRASAGLITRTASSLLFIIPWKLHWIIGTTDTAWDLDLAHPAASQTDIDYVLEHANALLEEPLSPDDVVGVYAGLRPLLAGESDVTSTLSREHAVMSPVPGLTVVAGGKYTTYRVMAKDAVDAVARCLGGSVPESCTERVPLLGAEGYHAAWNRRHQLAKDSGLGVARVEHLLGRYGSLIDELLELVAEHPELGQPIAGAEAYLEVEAYYAVRAEGALHLDDVLTRRTRISIETPDRGVDAAAHVAELVADLLGWDESDVAREVEHYRARVAAELASQEQPDDRSADAARLTAPDVRGAPPRHRR